MRLSNLMAQAAVACLTTAVLCLAGCSNSTGDASTEAPSVTRRATPAIKDNAGAAEEARTAPTPTGLVEQKTPTAGGVKTEAAPMPEAASPASKSSSPAGSTNKPERPKPAGSKSGPAQGMPRLSARTVVPGLGSILKLTDDQKKQITAARQAVMNDPRLAEVRNTLKDPKATVEQRKAAQATAQQISQDLNQKTSAILTPEQTKLMQTIETAFKESAAAGRAKYEPKLKAAGSDRQKFTALQKEMIQAVMKDFGKKLEKILTPEQKEAMKKAALQMRQALMERAKRQREVQPQQPSLPGEPAPPGAPVGSASATPGSP